MLEGIKLGFCQVGACAIGRTAFNLRSSLSTGKCVLQALLTGKVSSLPLRHHESSSQTKSRPFPLAASQQALSARKGLIAGPHFCAKTSLALLPALCKATHHQARPAERI